MDIATQQILAGLTGGERQDPAAQSGGSGSGGGLANFGNKVKEYWDTVKTEQAQQDGGGGGGPYGKPSELQEVIAEKEALDSSFKHAARLLDDEIMRLQSPRHILRQEMDDNMPKTSEKIYVPMADQRRFNLIGRLLGPKGLTLKRMQAETQTKMTILGRGSIRDKKKEEEMRNCGDPAYAHLNDDLHILVEVAGQFSEYKLMAGVAEVRKMLIPNEEGMGDPMATKYLSSEEQQMYAPIIQGANRGRGGGRGGGPDFGPPRGGRGGSFGSPRGRGGRSGGPAVGRGRGGRGGRGGGGGMRGGVPRGRGRGGGVMMGGGGGGGGRPMVPDMSAYDEPHVGYGDRSHDRNGGVGGGGGSGFDDQNYSRGGPPLLGVAPTERGGGGAGGYGGSHEGYGNYGHEEQYFNSYSDNRGGERDWGKMSRTSRADSRYHPYQSGGGGGYY